ncbi:hypothetical protein SPI_03934 [Niveomyces insectorum RCEF 264]|uniref:Uncharacterized protein n=1 Tax=Niveomyces insectorum RCEF 264 TaxID=1081102 RepID=A0A167WGT5_9HYPO|nr:hypothetical protein SPI_03934 [Niveomyces insectorum RCEF 264]
MSRSAHKPTPNWRLMDPERVKREAERIEVRHTATPRQLDDATEHLIQQLLEIRQATTPIKRSATGKRNNAFWNYKTVNSTRALRSAEREHRRQRTEVSADALREARQVQKTTLQEERTRTWRETTAEATRDSKLLWRLASWGKLRSHTATEQPQLPSLLTDTGGVASTKEEKAKALADKFFPDTIPGEPPTPSERRGWIASLIPDVTEEDVARALNRPSPWKAAGLHNYTKIGSKHVPLQ